MSKGQSLQDPFLNALRRERVPVSIYLELNSGNLSGAVMIALMTIAIAAVVLSVTRWAAGDQR